MQYLAILDQEELVFLDGVRKCWIDIAWHNFHPQARTTLDEPVTYDTVYCTENVALIMGRIQHELYLALQQLAGKEQPHGMGREIKFSGQKKLTDD